MSKHTVSIEVDDEVPVGDRMKRARKLAGLSAEQLGEQLGMHRNMVYLWESGARRPRRMVLMAWAHVTGVSADWLLDAPGVDGLPTCQYVGAA